MEPSRADDVEERARLVSTIAHELRGPIATIKGIAATTRTHFAQLPEEDTLEFLELIEQESARMMEIVDEASLAMKLSAGLLTLQRAPADLSAIVREGVGAAALGEDRVVDLDLVDLTVEADRTRLVEVVRQVVQNADDFSPRDEPIAVRSRREADHAVVEVIDHGPGIPEQEREHVFSTFPNWRPAGYEEVQGTGLGLFISRALVGEHHGQISIEEAPGGGTMLRILLPLEGTERG
ncbi:MAG TPA: ATP-binding protein [Actinomycetota bacterium]|nr:ATP-binding protein [Actinomycetota bacterium]